MSTHLLNQDLNSSIDQDEDSICSMLEPWHLGVCALLTTNLKDYKPVRCSDSALHRADAEMDQLVRARIRRDWADESEYCGTVVPDKKMK